MALKNLSKDINDCSFLSRSQKRYAIQKLRRIAMNPRLRKLHNYNKRTNYFSAAFIWNDSSNDIPEENFSFVYWSNIGRAITLQAIIDATTYHVWTEEAKKNITKRLEQYITL